MKQIAPKDQEKHIEKRLNQEMERLGCLSLKFSSATQTGYPDRIILLPSGDVVFAEIKTRGKKPTPMQEHRAKQLRGLGFRVFVIASDDDLNEFIKEIYSEL